jgi:hypothetical protein
MNVLLNAAEVRVLGSLMEKETTTPDYYPLSLNALLHACNQKSSREPVMTLDEDAVRDALHSLGEKGLAGPTSTADSRVTKYEHRIGEAFNLGRPEFAVLCLLLLRGPQTPGELRGRAERMYRFDDLDQVQSALQRLMNREPPLAAVLPRQPGTKEARYAHLLAGEVTAAEPEAAPESADSADSERIARLEDQVASLQQEIVELKQQLAEFRKQFE